jgi:hypothetical protein
MGRKAVDLKNKRFGKLVVINRGEDVISPLGKRHVTWNCICDCGNSILVRSGNLISGSTTSCGCIKMEGNNIKHGKCYTRIYGIYKHMIQRCYYKKSNIYKYYGERGITVCDEWLNDFEKFYDWAINNGYQNNLTIDRKNTNGNYEPNNCRWITMKEQNNNRRSNHLITLNGETHNIDEWCMLLNLNRSTYESRIASGLSCEEALTKPVKKHTHRKD